MSSVFLAASLEVTMTGDCVMAGFQIGTMLKESEVY